MIDKGLWLGQTLTPRYRNWCVHFGKSSLCSTEPGGVPSFRKHKEAERSVSSLPAETDHEGNPSLLLLSKVASILPSLGYSQKQQQEIHAGNGGCLELAGALLQGQEVQNKPHHL